MLMQANILCWHYNAAFCPFDFSIWSIFLSIGCMCGCLVVILMGSYLYKIITVLFLFSMLMLSTVSPPVWIPIVPLQSEDCEKFSYHCPYYRLTTQTCQDVVNAQYLRRIKQRKENHINAMCRTFFMSFIPSACCTIITKYRRNFLRF